MNPAEKQMQSDWKEYTQYLSSRSQIIKEYPDRRPLSFGEMYGYDIFLTDNGIIAKPYEAKVEKSIIREMKKECKMPKRGKVFDGKDYIQFEMCPANTHERYIMYRELNGNAAIWVDNQNLRIISAGRDKYLHRAFLLNDDTPEAGYLWSESQNKYVVFNKCAEGLFPCYIADNSDMVHIERDTLTVTSNFHREYIGKRLQSADDIKLTEDSLETLWKTFEAPKLNKNIELPLHCKVWSKKESQFIYFNLQDMDKQVAGITQGYYISNDELHGIWVSSLTGIVADVVIATDNQLIGRRIHTVSYDEILADLCSMGLNKMPDYIKICLDDDDSSLKHYAFFKKKDDPTLSENLTYYTTNDNLLNITVSNLSNRVAATTKAKIFVGKLVIPISEDEYKPSIFYMPNYIRIQMKSCRYVYFTLFTGSLYEPEVSTDVMYDTVYYAAKNRKGVFVDKRTDEIVKGSYQTAFSRKIEGVVKEEYEQHMLDNTDILTEPTDMGYHGRHIHLMIEGPNGKVGTYADVPHTTDRVATLSAATDRVVPNVPSEDREKLYEGVDYDRIGTKGSEASVGLTDEQYKRLVREPGEPDIVDVVNEYMKSTDKENFDWNKALNRSPKPVKHKLNFTGIVSLFGSFIIGGLIAVLTFGEMKEMVVMGYAAAGYAFASIGVMFNQQNKLKEM